MSNTNLWWAYDGESGSFSTLPAGPMLLPALGIFAFVAIAKALKSNGLTPKSAIGNAMYNSDLYQKDKARFNYLINKKIQAAKEGVEGLSLAELNELENLRYPSWNGGRPWHNW